MNVSDFLLFAMKDDERRGYCVLTIDRHGTRTISFQISAALVVERYNIGRGAFDPRDNGPAIRVDQVDPALAGVGQATLKGHVLEVLCDPLDRPS
jgi:hypothetical protein